MKILSWRKDLKLNAARCFSGTHATVRVTKEAVVTSGSRVKRVLIWAMSKWRNTLCEVKTFSWRKDLKLNAHGVSQGHMPLIYRRSSRDKRFPREACFDLGKVDKRLPLGRCQRGESRCEVKSRMKTLSWRKDLKLNAARCFSGTHATVRFTKQTVVTSGSCVKRVLTRAM